MIGLFTRLQTQIVVAQPARKQSGPTSIRANSAKLKLPILHPLSKRSLDSGSTPNEQPRKLSLSRKNLQRV